VEREVKAVDGVSFEVRANEIYGLAGESSSGKSTLLKAIAAAMRPPLQVVGGAVRLRFLGGKSIHAATPAELAALRWRKLSYIMQGSMSALNPVRRVRRSFEDFAARHLGGTGGGFEARCDRAPGSGSARQIRARGLPARIVGRHAPARHHRARHDLPARPRYRR
jgi:peptide/nickel transport system ATP-binding protein